MFFQILGFQTGNYMFFVEFPGASYHNRSNKNNLEKFFLTLEQSYLCYYQ